VEYGDGQDVKVVEVPWVCRSIEGFEGKPVGGPNIQLYIISKVRNGRGRLTGINPMPCAWRIVPVKMACDGLVANRRFQNSKVMVGIFGHHFNVPIIMLYTLFCLP